MPGNRCANCNKWVSLETDDPEEQSVEVNDYGTVEVEVSISRNCADCGQQMKEATITGEADLDDSWISEHSSDDAFENGHGDWEAESSNMELTESGGGRYAKNMIGFSCSVTVTCKCGATSEVTVSGEEAASSFDEV